MIIQKPEMLGKFKAKSASSNRWVKGPYFIHLTRQECVLGNDYLKADEIKHYIIMNGFADWNMPRPIHMEEILPETLCRYVCTYDNVDVFENDIIYDKIGKKTGVIKYGLYQNKYNDTIEAGHIGFYVEWNDEDTRVDLGYWLNSLIKFKGNTIDNSDIIEL